ncbi:MULTISPECIES: hypothetical protein [Nonomuraea]|uniref:D-alanine--D-alanine ligase C-terminal domain-containing protein n=2 Tax=Nonomuraea TaxID=83681 RepID=A0ABW4SUV5_9ACTN
MGSSVGVSRVTSLEKLRAGIEPAFTYDRVVIVDQGVTRDGTAWPPGLSNQGMWCSSRPPVRSGSAPLPLELAGT